MKQGRFPAVVLMVFVFLLMVSCSAGNFVAPDEKDAAQQQYSRLTPLVTEYGSDGNPLEGWGVLGLFDVHFDKSKGEVSMTSLRKSSLYDVLEVVDITNFLTLAPCTDCAKIESFQLNSDNTVSLNISIRHPFQVGDPLKPITGKNRADLHVFNVEGLVVATPDTETSVNFNGLGEKVGHAKLVNADGYSPYLDVVLDDIMKTQATIHPYKLHFRDYGVGNFNPSSPTGFIDVLHPSGNLVMAMGCAPDVREYRFDLGSSSELNFIYAVGCTYAVSAANKNMRFNPEYRIPQHNKKAASEVHVEIKSNNLMHNKPSSQCTLRVKVLDMSHGVPVGDNLDQMHAASNVGAISVEVAGVTSSPVTISSPTPLGGTNRDPDNPLLYEITFTNSASASQGTYLGLVKVTDTYQTGQNTTPLLNAMDGIKRVSPIQNPLVGLFGIDEFATYAVFRVDVTAATNPPICNISTIPSSATVGLNRNITFDGTASYDTDGVIQSYEWDFEYDGVNFNVDDTGAIVTTQYATLGDRNAALRVIDDLNASTICTVEVHVVPVSIPDDFVQIDDTHFTRNVTIVEDYNKVLHAFYGKVTTGYGDESSNIYWAYSEDMGNTWLGHVKLYDTTGLQWHMAIGAYHTESIMAWATSGPIIYITWKEIDYLSTSTYYQRIMAAQVDIGNLSSPGFSPLVVHSTEPNTTYSLQGSQIIATSTNKIMMYYMQYQGTGWFVPYYKFAPSFSALPDTITPSVTFSGHITNGNFVYVYMSSANQFAVDSHDNIFFIISGRFSGISNPSPPPGVPDYNTGYGSAYLRYNNSGDYSSGDNWTITQHFGRSGMVAYWDNWTQAICIDENDIAHWVFEYQINGTGPYGNDGGDYFMVYATGPSTGQWNFSYTDPIRPELKDSGPKVTAEFIYASIDTNSQGEVWITYQDSINIPEIYYVYKDTSWQAPVNITVPPMDSGYYPYMFISSWDAMYVVFSDASSNGYPWIRAIDTL